MKTERALRNIKCHCSMARNSEFFANCQSNISSILILLWIRHFGNSGILQMKIKFKNFSKKEYQRSLQYGKEFRILCKSPIQPFKNSDSFANLTFWEFRNFSNEEKRNIKYHCSMAPACRSNISKRLAAKQETGKRRNTENFGKGD